MLPSRSGVVDVDAETGVERLAARDAAALLYEHAVGGLAVTALASIALVAMLPDPSSTVKAWLGIMALVLCARAIDLLASRKRRAAGDWDGRAEIRRFRRGVFATAATWTAFPVIFFHQLDPVERTTMAIIMSAMAGGSATVLAAELPIAVTYCAALLIPASLMFVLTPGRDNVLLGSLGIIFFLVMAAASNVTHRATMSAIRLSRVNQALLAEMECERERTERANLSLTTTQIALRETLETLEDRIAMRTADLEHEIRERERFSRELARLASTDSLTGMCNRAMLAERLEALLAQTSGPVAVLFIDLDKFKEVNDVKGHYAGDTVLREVAARIAGHVAPGAIAARWGGDEFVVVIAGAGIEAARETGAQLRHVIGLPIGTGADAVRVDATIGIALSPRHGRTPDELVRAADMAMYAAKESGRGRVRVFEPELAAEIRSRHLLGQALREAIPGHALRLEFQPIVATHTRRCTSLEALLRWSDPQRGTVAPNEFIPLAERTGEIVRIGRWVLAQACRAAAGWPGAVPPAVSVNVSVAQIIGGTVLDDVRAALEESGLPPQRLHVEVTESLFAADAEHIMPTLAELRRMGVRILLDDFGTGFSSMARLRLLPLDVIKIDQSFVRAMEIECGPIITAMRSLGRAFDIELVAEGVETANQAALLRAMDVEYLQGYWIARPLPAEMVAAWLVRAASASDTAHVRSIGAQP